MSNKILDEYKYHIEALEQNFKIKNFLGSLNKFNPNLSAETNLKNYLEEKYSNNVKFLLINDKEALNKIVFRHYYSSYYEYYREHGGGKGHFVPNLFDVNFKSLYDNSVYSYHVKLTLFDGIILDILFNNPLKENK